MVRCCEHFEITVEYHNLQIVGVGFELMLVVIFLKEMLEIVRLVTWMGVILTRYITKLVITSLHKTSLDVPVFSILAQILQIIAQE
jgi:hypothetical protein